MNWDVELIGDVAETRMLRDIRKDNNKNINVWDHLCLAPVDKIRGNILRWYEDVETQLMGSIGRRVDSTIMEDLRGWGM